MNAVINDYGQTVRAIGAPGSIERLKCERPKLIETLQAQRDLSLALNTHYSAIEASNELRSKHGIESQLERDSIIACAGIK
jgi:hypothetical protein